MGTRDQPTVAGRGGVRISFNAKAVFSADGTGYFRELGKVEGAAAKLAAEGEQQAKIAADATKEKIALEQKLGNLKRGEANLAPRVQATAAAGEEAKARAAGSAMAAAQLERERAAQAKLAAEAERAGKAKLAAEAALVKAQGRVDVKTAAGSPLPVKLEEQLAAAKARVTLATQAQAKAEAARDAQASARAARLAQLERRASVLAGAATTAKAGSQEHDRLTQALARVQGQAVKTTAEIERLARVSRAAGAASATAFSQAQAAKPTAGGQIKAGLAGAGGSLVAGFGAPLGIAAAGAGIAALAHKTVEYGGKITDLSARLGVSTDALQEFDHAATMNGATLEDFTGALQKLAIARQEALEKGGEKMEAFRALGISVEQLKTARVEDLFKGIGRSVRDAADVQTVLVDAVAVMGKGSGNVLAAMRNDLEATGEEARRLGLIIGTDTLAKLDELGDKTDTLGKRLMAGFAPAILFVVEGFNKIADGFAVAAAYVTRAAELAGKVSAGVSLRVAIREGDAGLEQDLRAIADRAEARQQARAIAPRGPAALGLRGEGADEGRATREAEKVVRLKEQLAQLERDALEPAQRRLAIEEEIARMRQEQVNLAANGLDEVRKLELEVAIRRQEKELAKDEPKERAARAGREAPQTDALARIGLFVGGAPVGVKVQPLTGAEHRQELRNVVKALQDANARELAELRRLQSHNPLG